MVTVACSWKEKSEKKKVQEKNANFFDGETLFYYP